MRVLHTVRSFTQSFYSRNPIAFGTVFNSLVLLFVSFGLPVAAYSDLPTAASVIANFKEVSGGDAWDKITNIESHFTLKQGGIAGSDLNWQDLPTGRSADHYVVGETTSGDGYDGTKSWVSDGAGISRYLDSDEDLKNSVTAAYLVSMSFMYPDRRPGTFESVTTGSLKGANCTIVTAVPTGGYPIDLWFDNGNHLLVRVVEHTSRTSVIDTFGDYRTVGGVKQPYTSVVSNGDPKYDMTMSITSILVNTDIPDANYTIPAQASVDYSIADGQGSVTVPFIYALGHIYLPIRVNGHGPFVAILDSGARLAMNPNFAHANNISYAGRLPGSGIGPATVNEGIADISDLEIGDITINHLQSIVLPMPMGDNTMLIGAEVFKRFAVAINYDTQQLTLTPLPSFNYTGVGTAVPFHFVGDSPEIDGTVDGIPGRFSIDTGSNNSIDIFPGFIKDNKLLEKYKPTFSTIDGFGVGGAQTASVTRLGALSLGGVSVPNILAYLSNAKSGAFTDTGLSGNVGGGFLHRFNLTFDYARQVIYFEPNSHHDEVDIYERFGAIFTSNRDGVYIQDVIKNSPADQSGIKIGDVVLSLDGRRLSARDGVWLEEQIQQPVGTKLTLQIRHEGKIRKVAVVLKDLV